jgi:hypothetical protein
VHVWAQRSRAVDAFAAVSCYVRASGLARTSTARVIDRLTSVSIVHQPVYTDLHACNLLMVIPRMSNCSCHIDPYYYVISIFTSHSWRPRIEALKEYEIPSDACSNIRDV